MPMTSEQREIAAEGATSHIHTSGRGSTTYVLVHGIGASSRYFRPLAEQLSRDALVHSVDLPGHGQAPKPDRPLSVPDYAPERGFWRQALRLGQDTLLEPPSVNALLFTGWGFRCGLSWYLKTPPCMLGHHIEDAIGAVEAPLLIARGAKDPIVPPTLGRAAGRAEAGHGYCRGARRGAGTDDEIRAAGSRSMPSARYPIARKIASAGRGGTPDEVGNIGALLMGPDGAFITGSDFLMDGGVTASYFYGELVPY